tara:strand:- start:2 stop:394 length:393 start_codon:yes stop_codon:yes gene_type:complete
MDSDSFLNEDYESLNDAILQAIAKSKEVQDVLAKFKKQGHLNEKAVLNLFLSLDELYQMINEKSSEPGLYKLEPGILPAEESRKNTENYSFQQGDIIDGKLLSINEILFEKYYQGNFNQDSWMKKARVRF